MTTYDAKAPHYPHRPALVIPPLAQGDPAHFHHFGHTDHLGIMTCRDCGAERYDPDFR
jgi:hypothetical protein